jgi:ABC-type bacteriocin/lantibiotic exporter with double-glycine peptidase domain
MLGRSSVSHFTRLCALLAIVPWQGALGVCGEADEKSSLEGLNEVICGPRCVYYVLKHSGRDEPLASLVREMQWPDLTKGSTVAQMEKALTSRGIHVRSIQLKRFGSARPESPAIVHLRKEGDAEEDLKGHFVVLLPESTEAEALVWDGVLGIRREPWIEFSKKMTGTIMLTGDAPIENVDEVLRLRGPLSAWEVCLWAALVLGLVCVIPLGPRALRGLAKRSSLRGSWKE